jgi:hypothetical protein
MFRKSLAAIIGATLAFGAGVFPIQPTPIARAEAPRPSRRLSRSASASSSSRFYGTRGVGINMAQQQRAARKARNVQRHKSHVRGVK